MTEKQKKLHDVYIEVRDRLHRVARTYQVVPEDDAGLEIAAVEMLKEVAIDFAHAERAAWEAGCFDVDSDPPKM